MLPLKRTHYCTQLSLDNVDQEVIVTGWVQKRRDHGGVIFIDLRDRSGIVQVTVNPELCDEEVLRVQNTCAVNMCWAFAGPCVLAQKAWKMTSLPPVRSM